MKFSCNISLKFSRRQNFMKSYITSCRAQWRHLANVIDIWTCAFFGQWSPQHKLEIDHFSRLCTAHGRKFRVHYNWRPYPPKLPLHMGDLYPHLIRFLDPIRAHNGSATFAQMTADMSVYFTMVRLVVVKHIKLHWKSLMIALQNVMFTMHSLKGQMGIIRTRRPY